jgi:hypothetical protein
VILGANYIAGHNNIQKYMSGIITMQYESFTLSLFFNLIFCAKSLIIKSKYMIGLKVPCLMLPTNLEHLASLAGIVFGLETKDGFQEAHRSLRN